MTSSLISRFLQLNSRFDSRLDSQLFFLDSRSFILDAHELRINDRVENRDSKETVNLLLHGTVQPTMGDKTLRTLDMICLYFSPFPPPPKQCCSLCGPVHFTLS